MSDAEVSESEAWVCNSEDQAYGSASGKKLQQQQMQRSSNEMLHRELRHLANENRQLRGVVAELRSSLCLKNREVETLTNRVAETGRLLEEQVEEFRHAFGAVTRDRDEQLDALAAENGELRTELADLNRRLDHARTDPCF